MLNTVANEADFLILMMFGKHLIRKLREQRHRSNAGGTQIGRFRVTPPENYATFLSRTADGMQKLLQKISNRFSLRVFSLACCLVIIFRLLFIVLFSWFTIVNSFALLILVYKKTTKFANTWQWTQWLYCSILFGPKIFQISSSQTKDTRIAIWIDSKHNLRCYYYNLAIWNSLFPVKRAFPAPTCLRLKNTYLFKVNVYLDAYCAVLL